MVTFQGSKVAAEAAPALFPGIQVNTSISSNKQDITNELTQIMENLCTADVNQTIQDNIVYATDSTLGNIGFLQEGNAAAKCVMENSGRLQLQMRQEGDTTAKAGRNISLLAGLIGLILVVVIIIVVVSQIRKNTSEKGGGPEGATGTNGQKKPSMLGNMQGGLQGVLGGNRGGAKSAGAAKSMGAVRR